MGKAVCSLPTVRVRADKQALAAVWYARFQAVQKSVSGVQLARVRNDGAAGQKTFHRVSPLFIEVFLISADSLSLVAPQSYSTIH